MSNPTHNEVQAGLMAVISTLKSLKPEDRSENARLVQIVITEVQKVAGLHKGLFLSE